MSSESPLTDVVDRTVQLPPGMVSNFMKQGRGLHKLNLVLVAVATVLLAFSIGLFMGLSTNTDEADGKSTAIDGAGNSRKPNATSGDTTLNASNSFDPCEDFKNDVRAAARVVGENYIRNANIPEVRRRTSTGSEFPLTNKASAKSTFSSQQYGVEEVDEVKSNGTHLFLAYGNDVVIVDHATLTIQSRTTVRSSVDGNVPGVLVLEDRLVAFSTEFVDRENTTVHIYDIASMALITRETVQGRFVTASNVGTNVHLVTSVELSMFGFEESLSSKFIQSLTKTPLDEETYRRMALEQLELQLDYVVERVTRSLDCKGYWRSPIPIANETHTMIGTWRSGFITISSFDASLSVLSVNETKLMLPDIYFRTFILEDCIVLASPIRWRFTAGNKSTEGPGGEETYVTCLTVFSHRNATHVPLSPVLVAGHAYDLPVSSMDQFKTSEKSYIRIGLKGGILPLFQVSIFEITGRSNEAMPMVGQVAGLGKNADYVHAVLYQGDRAFVASTNGTGILYAIDLSDPTNPHAVGEVAFFGYAKSLLDIGENLILCLGGLGYSPTSGSLGIVQLTLFDVSNVRQPRVVDQWSSDLPGDGNITQSVTSDMAHDHKAARYLVDHHILVVPVTVSDSIRKPCSEVNASWGSEFDVEVFNPEDGSPCIKSIKLGDSFDGFRLFRINTTSITPFLLMDKPSIRQDCSPGFLASRSLGLDNVILTLQEHWIMSYNVSAQTTGAAIDLNAGVDCPIW